MIYWQVAVDAPIFSKLTYATTNTDLGPGCIVKVPLGRGNRPVFAVTLEKTSEAPDGETKNILEVYNDFSPISNDYLNWLEWLSSYYLHPIGQVAKLLSPPLKEKKEGKSRKSSPIPKVPLIPARELNEEQQNAVDSISSNKGFQTHLLFGVTGSGKTEVYLQLFKECIERGEKGLFLLPEISLTPQLLRRFAEVLGQDLAVIHSQLTKRERTIQWLRITEGDAKILLGARSALFCPIDNLGIIVVDEEHEASYKQEEKLKYNARDAAIMLAHIKQIPIVLGSATPSIETWHNANIKKYQLHTLAKRFNDQSLPQITVIDLKENDKRSKLPFWLSKELHEKISERLENKEQIALFLNRRGSAPSVVCNACAHTKECPNCAVSLTLHSKTHLHCHYCDYHENYSELCDECGEGEMIPLGLGTEKVEEDIKQLFPQAKIARADRDEIDSRYEMENLIESMEKQEIDILIGTQMISKGLDFPNLTLVSILLADIGFHIQDFRANERSYQLISQVSGRAGRHLKKGEVLVQTYTPTHPVLPFVIGSDYVNFANQEILFRKELSYPPFSKVVRLRIQSTWRNKAEACSQQVHHWLKQAFDHHKLNDTVQILGPAEAPMHKLRGKYRFQILIKIHEKKNISSLFLQLLKHKSIVIAGTKVLIDVDPIQMN